MDAACLISVAFAVVLATTRFFLARKSVKPLNALSVVATILLIVPVIIQFSNIAPRGQSKSFHCISNVKQLSLGLLMYANDNSDRLPMRHALTGSTQFMKPTQERSCPQDPDVRYGVNGALLGANLGLLEDSTDILMIAETPRTDEVVNSDGDLAYPHAGKVTIGFADGHAKGMPNNRTQALWKKGHPVQFRVIPPPVDFRPFFRLIWYTLCLTLYFGGVPASILFRYMVPKGSERRRFWTLAAWSWAAVFVYVVLMPQF